MALTERSQVLLCPSCGTAAADCDQALRRQVPVHYLRRRCMATSPIRSTGDWLREPNFNPLLFQPQNSALQSDSEPFVAAFVHAGSLWITQRIGTGKGKAISASHIYYSDSFMVFTMLPRHHRPWNCVGVDLRLFFWIWTYHLAGPDVQAKPWRFRPESARDVRAGTSEQGCRQHDRRQ